MIAYVEKLALWVASVALLAALAHMVMTFQYFRAGWANDRRRWAIYFLSSTSSLYSGSIAYSIDFDLHQMVQVAVHGLTE